MEVSRHSLANVDEQPTYFSLLPNEINTMTEQYKRRAEEMERNMDFLLLFNDIFFRNYTQSRAVLNTVPLINNIFKQYQVEAEVEIYDRTRSEYGEPEYSLEIMTYQGESYSDALLKELISFLLESDKFPLCEYDPYLNRDEDIKERPNQDAAINSINRYAKRHKSPIRVINNRYLNEIEVVTIYQS